MKKVKLLVIAKDYNGHKDILFMMNENDSRITENGKSNNGNYEILDYGDFENNILTVSDNVKYKVFEDWSVKEI